MGVDPQRRWAWLLGGDGRGQISIIHGLFHDKWAWLLGQQGLNTRLPVVSLDKKKKNSGLYD